jgi:hypothetical protein
MILWLALACTGGKADTAETGAPPTTTAPDTEVDTDTHAETDTCVGDEAWLVTCVYDNPYSLTPRPDATVYALPPGDDVPIETVVDAAGCVTWPASAGAWQTWAVSDGGYCTSERADATLEACETVAVDLFTEDGCVG